MLSVLITIAISLIMEEFQNDQPDTEETGENSELVEHIIQSLKQGQKLQAIKAYRESTGAGLKESKAVIDELIDKYQIPSKSGCASMILLCLSSTCLVGVAIFC